MMILIYSLRRFNLCKVTVNFSQLLTVLLHTRNKEMSFRKIGLRGTAFEMVLSPF